MLTFPSHPGLRVLALALVQTLFSLALHGQCSDAGACAAGRVEPSRGNQIALSLQGGATGPPDFLSIRGFRLDALVRLGPSTALVLTLPFQRIEGPRGRVSGLGDSVLILDQALVKEPSWGLSAQVGSRLSTGKADADPTLPQAYQTGLGPSDLMLGLRGSLEAWQGGLVYQKAGGRSANPITRLRRGDDAVAWLSRSFEWQETRITVKGLGIKRLSLSSVRDIGASSERFVDVPDSDRLQLNLDLEVMHPLTKALRILGRADLPILKRSTNVDGLKRSRSLSLGLVWSF